ncbi:GON-4-like protein [Festucalex cinctus]
MKSVCKRLKAESCDLPSPAGSREGHDDDDADAKLIITTDDEHGGRRTLKRRRKRQMDDDDEDEEEKCDEDERAGEGLQIDTQLDQSLESKSKQHKLTGVNVRNIIHEVITNEHVVAMMKAAINETEAVPPFELKMTRSKLKEVVEKGVVIPAWNISPIKKKRDVNKVRQFVDIPLAEEDSDDDEEYRPDNDDDEDETAEDTLQESDFECAASPPGGCGVYADANRHAAKTSRAESASMGPPPPPKAPPPCAPTDNFLEKLHAVEAELAVCMEPYQPLEGADERGLMAYRTRSKRPLRDVPLGQLEAELRAPDITPDMYDDCGPAHEDSDWTDWLRGLMTSDVDNEEECDDEDDPEYNFLADVDEPDQEDYRDDKAVRITKKEVNELMEELFETLKEDPTGPEADDEGHDDDEEEWQEEARARDGHVGASQAYLPVDEACSGGGGEPANEQPMRGLRTVKQHLDKMRNAQRRRDGAHVLRLNAQHRSTLAQQVQQHVQLLLQIHLLTSAVEELGAEAEITRLLLFELQLLAQRGELTMSMRGGAAMASRECRSAFRASNLQGALNLLDELRERPVTHVHLKHTPDARGQVRRFPLMPAELAWLFATRPAFLYPQLLPTVSLDPDLYCPRRTTTFTAAENCLLVLGLQNFSGSSDPARLLCDLLLAKSVAQVRRRILQCCRPGTPPNIVKAFRYERVLPHMPLACDRVAAWERRPPVQRDVHLMPLWLLQSLPAISKAVSPASPCDDPAQAAAAGRGSAPATHYPPRLPPNLHFRRKGFAWHAPSAPPGPAPSGEAEAVLPALSQSSGSGVDVGVAKVTEYGATSCHGSQEAEPRPPRGSSHARSPVAKRTGSDAHAHQREAPPAVSANNISMGVNGEKMVVWTREADRLLLTACQQQGANWKTFRRVSAQLGSKSARQVSLRFHDLLDLFHVAATSQSRPELADTDP